MVSTRVWYSVSLPGHVDHHSRSADTEAGQQDAPNYFPGIIAVMAINVAAVVVAIVTMLLLRRQNQRADKGQCKCEDREGFRYTL